MLFPSFHKMSHKIIRSFFTFRCLLQDYDNDDNMYCCVLHGLGGNFCAGYDLDELADLKDDLANKIAEILMDQGPMVRVIIIQLKNT